MGRAVMEAVDSRDDCVIVAGVDLMTGFSLGYPIYHEISAVEEAADVVIDFSHPSLLGQILHYCKSSNTAAILCTTGYSEAQTEQIKTASTDISLFYSRNMSLGVNLLIQLAKKAQEVLGDAFDVEIIEMHHNQKIDAPSGTALMIADAINDVQHGDLKYEYDRHSKRQKREKTEIGIHAVRGGTIVGEHQVVFAGNHETLTLSHSAQSKELFASGAVKAALFMKDKQKGLYDMSDII